MLQDLLRKVPLFSDLDPSELGEVVLLFKKRSFHRGERLLVEGQSGDFLLVIETGRTRVHRRMPDGSDLELARLGSGALLGDMALIDAAPRSAGVTAIENVVTHQLGRNEFLKLVIAKSPAALKILRRVAISTVGRLREVNRRIRAISDELSSSEAPTQQTVSSGFGDPVQVLSRMPFFKAFKASELQELQRCGRQLDLNPKDLLFRRGDARGSCYFVLGGRLQLTLSSGLKISNLGQGTVLGHFSFLDGAPRSAEGVAVDNCRVLELRRSEYDALFERRSNLAFKLTEALARLVTSQLREANQQVQNGAQPGPTVAPGASDELMERVMRRAAERRAQLAAQEQGKSGSSGVFRSSSNSGAFRAASSSGVFPNVNPAASGSFKGLNDSSNSGVFRATNPRASGSFTGLSDPASSGVFRSTGAASKARDPRDVSGAFSSVSGASGVFEGLSGSGKLLKKRSPSTRSSSATDDEFARIRAETSARRGGSLSSSDLLRLHRAGSDESSDNTVPTLQAAGRLSSSSDRARPGGLVIDKDKPLPSPDELRRMVTAPKRRGDAGRSSQPRKGSLSTATLTEEDFLRLKRLREEREGKK